MPIRNAPTGSVQNISRVDVYRLAEPASYPLQISEEEFANRSTIITTVPVTNPDFDPNAPEKQDKPGSTKPKPH